QIIGNKKFVKIVKNKIENSAYVPRIDLNNDSSVIREKTLPEILKIVSKQTKVSADSILGQSRIRTITKTRRIFAFVSAKYAGYETVEISRFLKKNASSVSCMINKMECELEHDPILSEKINEIIHVFNVRLQK
ncbi:MAG: helix-turn-helix domain-containing protein, partial [Candidatus Aminicenantaceae bacterium]